jgi:hypothetical protein
MSPLEGNFKKGINFRRETRAYLSISAGGRGGNSKAAIAI